MPLTAARELPRGVTDSARPAPPRLFYRRPGHAPAGRGWARRGARATCARSQRPPPPTAQAPPLHVGARAPGVRPPSAETPRNGAPWEKAPPRLPWTPSGRRKGVSGLPAASSSPPENKLESGTFIRNFSFLFRCDLSNKESSPHAPGQPVIF